MEPENILQELRRRGIDYRASADSIIVQPRTRLDDHLRESIKTHKSALLDLIRQEMPWRALADSKADPEVAEPEQDQLFLAACRVFRGAADQQRLLVRWTGLHTWIAGELPEPALRVLRGLVHRLRQEGLSTGAQSNQPDDELKKRKDSDHDNNTSTRP